MVQNLNQVNLQISKITKDANNYYLDVMVSNLQGTNTGNAQFKVFTGIMLTSFEMQGVTVTRGSQTVTVVDGIFFLNIAYRITVSKAANNNLGWVTSDNPQTLFSVNYKAEQHNQVPEPTTFRANAAIYLGT